MRWKFDNVFFEMKKRRKTLCLFWKEKKKEDTVRKIIQ